MHCLRLRGRNAADAAAEKLSARRQLRLNTGSRSSQQKRPFKGCARDCKHVAMASEMRPCLVVSLCRENIGNAAQYARGERNVYLCGPGCRQDLGFALNLIFAETDAGVSPEPRKSYVFERLSKLRPIDRQFNGYRSNELWPQRCNCFL